MTQSSTIPNSQQITTLVQAQHNRFIKNREYDASFITQTDDGPVGTIDQEEIPLLDVAFDLQIVQPGHVTRNKALAPFTGKILIQFDKDDPAANEAAEVLNLMPITIAGFGFRNFGPYDEKGGDDANRLLCYSNDGVIPSERVAVPLNSVCSELVLRNGEYQRKVVCPHAVWNDDSKPDCRAVVTLGLFDIERRIPVRLQLHGTAYGSWNALQRAYKQAKNVARLKRKSINDYVIRMSLENNGTYFTPQFRLVEAEESLGKPSRFLPVCKYYMEKLFSRVVEEEPVVESSAMAEVAAVETTAEDTQAVADGQGFTL
jgi:hypothetical protein